MGHIKEPEGVDFIIKSEPLTKKEKEAISKFIREYKAKHSNKQTKRKTRVSAARKKAFS